jgi:hypothetical protein
MARIPGEGYPYSAETMRSSTYVLYHWLELWDWLASLGNTDGLEEIAREMHQMTAA